MGDSVPSGGDVRWGIAGPGAIATRFAEGLGDVEGAVVVAVGSRSRDRADAFGARFDIPRRYGSYEDLAADVAVDVVYVATPHSRHAADTLLFLNAGKHVLCEKPFALNATQARAMVAAAAASGRFVMEAMWSRFLPAYEALTVLLGEQRIGEPLLVEADFGFRSPVDPTHRHFDPAQGGGALLDLGVYPVQLSSLVLGTPDAIAAQGQVGSTGVDEQVAAVLHHPGGGLGVVKAAIRTSMACTARIAGTEGWVRLPAFMHCPDHLTVFDGGGERVVDARWDGEGLRFQAEEVHRCLAAGLLESPRMPLQETIEIAATMDTIRAQLGVRYPGELAR
jgi:predicted dehydrogenase